MPPEVVGADPTAADLGSMNYNYYITLVSITILVYDFILTFRAEVERLWVVRRVNWAICLFYLNRYLLIFGHIPVLIQNFWVTSDPTKMQICLSLQTYHEYFSAVVQFIVWVMLTMRIYALYKRNVRAFVVFIFISSALFAGGCWAAFGGYKDDVDYFPIHVGCGVTLSRDRAKRYALSWSSMFFFDLLVFCMTLYRILTLPQSNNAIFLTTVFMRDGAMYFCIMAASALFNVLSLLLGGPLSRNMGLTFTNVICSVMMSRLTLNLRDPSLIPVTRHDASEDTSYPNLTFVQSHFPDELLGEGSFAESEFSQGRRSGEAFEIRDRHRPASNDIELHRMDV